VSWAVYEIDQDVHVAPVLDSRDHKLAADCSCGPRRAPVPEWARPLWVHNSFDGREFTERAVDALRGAKN
jgi:hypothetical protein